MAKTYDLVRLNSTGTKEDGKKTGYFKTTKRGKSMKLKGVKLKKKCFDPRAYNAETGKTGMHVDFEEGKIK